MIQKVNWIGLYTFVARETGRMFRVWIQTLGAPWISSLLYILIFGHIVGQRIDTIAGVSYIDFVLPGIVMMNIMNSAFSHTSTSLYIMKWFRSIDELLVAPLSYFEMIVGFLAGGVVRGVIVGAGVYAIGVFFTQATIAHFFLMLIYAAAISTIFSLAGMLVALWAKNFEQLSLPSIFIITPLTFLGGVFNSIHMMPPFLQWIVRLNPFFYFVDGLRYTMLGISESNMIVGMTLTAGLILGLGYWVWYLFKVGYKIRE